MKKVTVAVAMMAAALVISAANAADLNLYSSRAALIGPRSTEAIRTTAGTVAGELSTRWALLTKGTRSVAEPQAAMVANYSSKSGLRNERSTAFELAPLK